MLVAHWGPKSTGAAALSAQAICSAAYGHNCAQLVVQVSSSLAYELVKLTYVWSNAGTILFL
jgi:hypothetical protein